MPANDDDAMTRIQRIGANAVCLSDDHRLLLSRYTPPDGRWVLPGGGVDHGEHPEETVVREAREETGYEVRVQRLLGIESSVWPTSDGISVHSA